MTGDLNRNAASADGLHMEATGVNAYGYYCAGIALARAGRLAEAADCYRQCLSLKSDAHRAINNLGVVHMLQNDLDVAEDLFRRALALRPEYPEALDNLGHHPAAQG